MDMDMLLGGLELNSDAGTHLLSAPRRFAVQERIRGVRFMDPASQLRASPRMEALRGGP